MSMAIADWFVANAPEEFKALATEIAYGTPPRQVPASVVLTYPRGSGGCTFERFTGPRADVLAAAAYIVAHDQCAPCQQHMLDIIDTYTEREDGTVDLILSKCHIPR